MLINIIWLIYFGTKVSTCYPTFILEHFLLCLSLHKTLFTLQWQKMDRQNFRKREGKVLTSNRLALEKYAQNASCQIGHVRLLNELL